MKDSSLVTRLLIGALVLFGLVTAYVGSMAQGYLVPALVLLASAGLLQFGVGRQPLRLLCLLNGVSGLLLVLVLWLGAGLEGIADDIKLDVSAGLLLLNLATGGPLMGLAAPFLVFLTAKGRPLARRFDRAPA